MEKVKILDKRFTLLLTLQLLILLLICFMLFKKNSDQAPSALVWRAVGNSLQSVGLTQEALEAYEKALLYGTEDHVQKALLAYTIGQLYQEQGHYEKALRFYYQTELLDPSFKEQAILNEKKVALLEKLKKYSAVQRTLAETTSLVSDQEASSKSSTDPIIANVGGTNIYRHQIQTAYDNVPPFFKKNVGTLKDFAKKYVADQVLFEKAKRLGFDKESHFKEQLVQLERELLVQKVIEEDVVKKVTISESDLENYFKANQSTKDVYKKAKSLQEIRQQVEADYRLEKQNARYQELIGESLKAQEVKLFFDRMDG